jgi:hypothetical protein
VTFVERDVLLQRDGHLWLILRRPIDEHTEPFHLQPDLVMLFNSWPTKLCIGMVKDALSTRTSDMSERYSFNRVTRIR